MKYTAIILAGGKSSRMGVDKGLMTFRGKAMVEHVINVVKPLVTAIMVVSNNNEYEQFGYPVYKDIIKDKGPIAGIYTGLKHSQTTKNIVLSCDVPFINEAVLKLLINNCEDVDVVIPENDSRTHQLIGVYDKSCVSTFKTELDMDQLKLKLAIKKLNCKVVDANHIDAKFFNNINSKDDIEA